MDDLRSMVVAGVVHPGAVWTDELVEQLHLARQSAVVMALRYQAAGFAVVIDDFYDPNSRLREYDDLARAGMVRVLLYPAAQKAHAQNLQRAGPGPGVRPGPGVPGRPAGRAGTQYGSGMKVWSSIGGRT